MNASATMPNPAANAAKPRIRDPRLDFFRGIAMFIIFVAHTPRDWWALWIPARFGFSDATEIFVFCSGMASAIAFGGVFATRGWWMGFARIAHRVWQVYWAHIGLFFAIVLLCVVMDQSGLFVSEDWTGSYVDSLNLRHFFTKTPDLIVGIFTLTYVPNYFDILPMYLVILAMVPLMMALSRISLWAVAAMVGVLWLAANANLLGLTPVAFPAEPWSDRNWFFNPFGWQLVFFTGFALMIGWIKPPPVDRRLVIVALAVVLLTVPFAWYRSLQTFPDLRIVSDALGPLTAKTSFGILRYVHFLALAYVAWVAVGPMGSRISGLGRGQVVVDVIRTVGQQSLAVFLMSMFFAQVVGALFKTFGNGGWMALFGNGLGFAVLIATAYGVGWFKRQPWKGLPATPNKTAAISSSDMAPTLSSGATALPVAHRPSTD